MIKMHKLTLEQFEKLLNDGREIVFCFAGKSFLVSRYWEKHFGKKGHFEYGLFPSEDSLEPIQTFSNIDQLLNARIDRQKLQDIISDIYVIEIY